MKRVLSGFLLLSLLLAVLPAPALASAEPLPIYVGHPGADYLAEEILKAIDLSASTPKERIRAVYDWVIANSRRYEWDGQYRFDAAAVQAAGRGEFAAQYQRKLADGEILLRPQWEETSGFCGTDYFDFSLDSNDHVGSYAYEMMMKMTGNCAHFSSMLTVLLGHLGYDSRLFHGMFINMDGTQVEHTWNYVLVDGTFYWMDVRIDHSIGDGSGQYFWVESTEDWAKEHSWPMDQSQWLFDHAQEIQATYDRAAAALYQPKYTCADWAKTDMDEAYARGLMPARLEDADLTGTISRQDFACAAVLLYESLAGVTVPEYEGISPFTDTQDAQVLKAYELGIINGMGDGTFAPDATLTREQAAAMLGRAYELSTQGMIFGGTFLPQSQSQFTDHGKIFDYAKSYIYFFVGTGIIDGMGDGTFAPKGTLTREQALKISNQCLKNLKDSQPRLEFYSTNSIIKAE